MNNQIAINVSGAHGLVPYTYKTVVLKPNVVDGKNILTQLMMGQTNTKYVIKYDYVIDPDIQTGIASVSESNISHCVNPNYAAALAAYNLAHDAWIDADNAYTNNPNDTTLAAKNAAYATYTAAQTTLNNTPQYYYYAANAIIVRQGQHINIPNGCVLLNDSLSGITDFVVAPADTTVYIGSLTAGEYNYTVQNAIVIPSGCLIEFDGGSISDGVLIGDETILIFDQEEDAVLKNVVLLGEFETPSSSSNGEINKKDNVDGMAIITLKKGKSLASQLTQTNTIYRIVYDFDLGGESVTMPDGCILEFDGGTISNGTLIGTDTYVDADVVKIFGTDLTLEGTWNVDSIWVNWFGAKGDGVTDDTDALQKAFNFCHRYIYPARTGYKRYDINFLKGTYILKKSLLVSPKTYIHGNGSTILPIKGEFTVVEGQQWVFIVNLNSDMTKPDMTYTDLWGIDDFMFGDYDDFAEGDETVGLIFSAAAAEINLIKTYNLCPFYSTTISPFLKGRSPADDEVDYQDRLSIDNVKMFGNTHFQAANANNCMIVKKTQGDTNRFCLIQNETNLKCFYIWSTYAGTIENCIHPDGYIYDSANFNINSSHFEKNRIDILYSNVTISNCYFHINDDKSPIYFQEMYPQKYGQAHSLILNSCVFQQLWSSLYNPKPAVHVGGQADYHNISVRDCRKYIGRALGHIPTNAIDIYDQRSNTIICLNSVNYYEPYRNVMPAISLIESGESSWNPSTTIKEGAEIGTYTYEFYFGDFNKTKSFYAGYKVEASVTTDGLKYLGFKFDNSTNGNVVVKRTSPSDIVRYAIIPMSLNGVFLDCYTHINGSLWSATKPVNYYLQYSGFAEMIEGEIIECSPINTVFIVNTARKWVKELNTDELKDLKITGIRQNKKGEINYGEEVFVSRLEENSIYKLLNLSGLGINYHECQYIICANTSAVLCRVENSNGTYRLNFRALSSKSDELKLYKDENNIVYIENTVDFPYSVTILAVSPHAEYCIAQNYAGALDIATLPGTATEIVLEQPTSGESVDRPETLTTSDKGFQFFDETLNKPIYWTGDTTKGDNGWVDANGNFPQANS